jgi:hypothetical protein
MIFDFDDSDGFWDLELEDFAFIGGAFGFIEEEEKEKRRIEREMEQEDCECGCDPCDQSDPDPCP